MSEFTDVAALFGSKQSARILKKHRSSVDSVDGDSEKRSISDVDVASEHSMHMQRMTAQCQQRSEVSRPVVITTEEEKHQVIHDESESSESDDESSSSASVSSNNSNRSSNSSTRETMIMKVLVVGNARCGKTCTIQRFTRNDFQEEYVSTIGADFQEKIVKYGQELSISLQLWDIAGQDRFAKFTRGYFREAKGAVIVCDITRANTFDAVETWKHEIDTCCQELNHGAEIPVVMVANKSDLLLNPMDALDLGVKMQKCVDKNKIIEWFRASAKSGEHIDDAFWCLIHEMVAKYRAEKVKNEVVKVNDEEEKPSSPPEVIRLSRTPPHYRAVKQHGFGCDCH